LPAEKPATSPSSNRSRGSSSKTSNGSKAEQTQTARDVLRYLLALPILLGMLGVIYDVGYLFYTLFSLSEHLLFSILVIPNLLVTIVTVTMVGTSNANYIKEPSGQT
jgi:hypothetical protein